MDVKDLLKRVGENLSVGRAFGTAYEKDGLLIIPVALVAGGGGGGGGGGPVSAEPAKDKSKSKGSEDVDDDEASGAGFGGVVLPVGAYVVKDDDVRWVPAVNVTLIALAALAVLRVAIRSTSRSRRRR